MEMQDKYFAAPAPTPLLHAVPAVQGSARRTSISFSPDGRQLQVGLLGISTSDLVIEVCWDLSNGERIRTEAMPHSHTCAF